MMLRDAEGLCVCIVIVCVNMQCTLVLFGGIEKTVVHLLWHKEPNITHRIQKECSGKCGSICSARFLQFCPLIALLLSGHFKMIIIKYL